MAASSSTSSLVTTIGKDTSPPIHMPGVLLTLPWLRLPCRYLAEVQSGKDKETQAQGARTQYEQATKVADADNMPSTHPLRLGLALNFAVCIISLPQQPSPTNPCWCLAEGES